RQRHPAVRRVPGPHVAQYFQEDGGLTRAARSPRKSDISGRMAVSRAGGKLEAAIERFQLARVIDGANAIDVGASTGGFTQALLAHGARGVLAVDVGHGQLHASLRADPRVKSLEGVDWRRLSLGVAEGPFDFF